MIYNDKHKHFLNSTKDLNKLFSEADMDKIKSPSSVVIFNTKLIELFEEQDELIKEVEENILKASTQHLKDYISFLLRDLENEKGKAKVLLKTQAKFYKTNFRELLASLTIFQIQAKDNRLNYGSQLGFYYDILNFTIKRIKILLHDRRPKLWPTEESEELQLFMKTFGKKSDVDRPFMDQRVAEACYKLLIELELIDKKFNFLGKNKAAFCLLIDKLKDENRKGIPVIENLSHAKYAELLSKKFNGLKLHRSNFTKPSPVAFRNYDKKMSNAIRNIRQNLV